MIIFNKLIKCKSCDSQVAPFFVNSYLKCYCDKIRVKNDLTLFLIHLDNLDVTEDYVQNNGMWKHTNKYTSISKNFINYTNKAEGSYYKNNIFIVKVNYPIITNNYIDPDFEIFKAEKLLVFL